MTEITIHKAEQDQHMVWGVVYAPMVPDSDGEFMDAETIRKMAYKFMAERKNDKVDVQHTNVLSPGARVVESFIARKGDPDFPEGAWVAGVHIPDENTWQRVKRHEINGFSIEAMVKKKSVEVEIELPATMEGLTYKSEDHEHHFYVNYDAQGRFAGGLTDTVNGHQHVIKHGTRTELAAGHIHRFAHLNGFQIQEAG